MLNEGDIHYWTVHIKSWMVQQETDRFLSKGGEIEELPDGPIDPLATMYGCRWLNNDQATQGALTSVSEMAQMASKHRSKSKVKQNEEINEHDKWNRQDENQGTSSDP